MLRQEILDEYRPYYDCEVAAAIMRIVQDPFFPQIAQYVFPEKKLNGLLEEFKQIKSIGEFQAKVMYAAICKIADKTIAKLSYDGVNMLSNDKSYMFIANHRDIVLDSAILQMIFVINKKKTSEITFGSNLMHPQLVVDIGKLNKMFKIIRGGTAREIFTNSLNVSEYMRYAITEKKESTWIAQRNGRTKDGNDKTEIAVLKMFAMSSKKPFAENLAELNITPVSVSYEYEPCDFLKTRELYLSRRQSYVKSPGEDLNSILHGIQQIKGNMHFTVCKTITPEELEICAQPSSASERFKLLAKIIDDRIYSGYRLWKTNYMAHDLLHKKSEFSASYSADDMLNFTEYMSSGLRLIDGDIEELQDIFLKIYAISVDNCR